MYSLRDMLPEMLRTKSKTDLAKSLGISRSTLDRYIKEPDMMSIRTLRTLAKINGYKVILEPGKTKYTL